MANNLLAYGFTLFSHLAADRLVDSIGQQTIFDAVTASAVEHTRVVNEMLSVLVQRTTDFKARFKLSGKGTLQPLTELGKPRIVREEGQYDVAYPIQSAGTGWGTTRVSRAKMTLEEANRLTVESLRRDGDWMKRHMLSGVYDNTNWTFVDEEKGSLTIKPLANNDGTLYPVVGGGTEDSQHFKFQAGAIADGAATNPYPVIFAQLRKHLSNVGLPVIVMIPTNVRAETEALTDFTPVVDPDITPGSATETISGNIASKRHFGDEVIGKANGCWIVEWSELDDDHLLAFSEGASQVLAMREHPETALQGLFTEFNNVDGNLQEADFIRMAGFGVRNRVGALMMQVENGSYVIPTNFTNPLSV